MAGKKHRKGGGKKPPQMFRNDYPSVLNRTLLRGLGVPPGSGVDKLVENISGCIDKNVVNSVLNGMPTSESGINKAIRESVLEGLAAADVHRTWLAELDRIASNAESLQGLRRAISAYVRQAGIETVADPKRAELYRVVGGGRGEVQEVMHPAYVDSINGRLILAGRLRPVHKDGPSRAEGAKGEESEAEHKEAQ